MKVKARCRYCEVPVSYFGEVCAQCEPSAGEIDGFVQILNADVAALAAKGDES